MAEVESARSVPNARHTHVFTVPDGGISTSHLSTSVYATTTTIVGLTPDDTANGGVATTVARGDHRHAVPCAVPVAVGTTLAEGNSTSLSRANHVHELGTGSIDTTAMLADDVVTLAKIASEAWTSATPTFTNVTLGTNGTSSMHWVQIGRTVHFRAGFTLGSGTGNVSGTITLDLPVSSSAGRRFCGIAAGTDASALGATFVGVAIISTTTLTVFSTSSWGTTTPFDWTNLDEFTVSGTYEAAS